MEEEMNKETFLDALRSRINIIQDDVIEEIIKEYSEIINDGIQKGLREEEAVADLGDVKEIANDLIMMNRDYQKNKLIFFMDRFFNKMEIFLKKLFRKNKSKRFSKFTLLGFDILIAILFFVIIKLPLLLIEINYANIKNYFHFNNIIYLKSIVWIVIFEFIYLVLFIVLISYALKRRKINNSKGTNNKIKQVINNKLNQSMKGIKKIVLTAIIVLLSIISLGLLFLLLLIFCLYIFEIYYFGIGLITLSALFILLLIIMILYFKIKDKYYSYYYVILICLSIICLGAGVSLTLTEISSTKIFYSDSEEMNKISVKEINMNNKLVFLDLSEDSIIIDDDRENIKFEYHYNNDVMGMTPLFEVKDNYIINAHFDIKSINFKSFLNYEISGLQKKEIYLVNIKPSIKIYLNRHNYEIIKQNNLEYMSQLDVK